MRRVYISGDLKPGQELVLPRTAYHHIVNVLRCPTGSSLTVFDGCGHAYQAQLTAIERNRATVRLLDALEPDLESPLHTTLVQAVIKGERMDYAIQKAVELGVSQIRPLLADQATLHLRGDRLQKKLGHWARIIVSACEQSGRNTVPPLLAPLTTTEALAQLEGPGIMLAPSGRPPFKALHRPRRITLFVGPEGGFSGNELGQATDKGVSIVGLGPRILRAETAAVVALSVVQTLWGDFTPPPGTDDLYVPAAPGLTTD